MMCDYSKQLALREYILARPLPSLFSAGAMALCHGILLPVIILQAECTDCYRVRSNPGVRQPPLECVSLGWSCWAERSLPPYPQGSFWTSTALSSPDQREVVLGVNRPFFCLGLFVDNTAKRLSPSSIFPFFPLQNDSVKMWWDFFLFCFGLDFFYT